MSDNGQQTELQPTPELRTVEPRGAQRRPLEGSEAPAQAAPAETPQRVGAEPQQAQQAPEEPAQEQAPEEPPMPKPQRKRITSAQRDDALARLRAGEDPAQIAESLGTAEKKIKDLKRRYLDKAETPAQSAKPKNAGAQGGATVSTSIRAPKLASDQARLLVELTRFSERNGVSLGQMFVTLELAVPPEERTWGRNKGEE